MRWDAPTGGYLVEALPCGPDRLAIQVLEVLLHETAHIVLEHVPRSETLPSFYDDVTGAVSEVQLLAVQERLEDYTAEAWAAEAVAAKAAQEAAAEAWATRELAGWRAVVA